MQLLTRFVLRTWLPPVLWAIDTPLEPLVSGRKRAVPLEDGELDQTTIALLDSHTYLAARMLSRWLISGIALTMLVAAVGRLLPFMVGTSVGVLALLLGSSDAQSTNAIAFLQGTYSIVSISAAVFWFIWGLAGMVRAMQHSVSALDNRLIVTLKRGVAGSQTLALLDALPADSAYRLYLSPVMKRVARRA